MAEKRAFIDSEMDALYRFEFGDGLAVGDGPKVLSLDRVYLCEVCGFETRSSVAIYDHIGECAATEGES